MTLAADRICQWQTKWPFVGHFWTDYVVFAGIFSDSSGQLEKNENNRLAELNETLKWYNPTINDY